ncbi:EAL domain-containing protein [Herbaspirillum rubrisubalbicans]|uniref:Signal peptide protein n=1 Tax=Herbaspirillum rubrisubalbicans TaxID=80842 RepID=A0ABX9C255_9BURK|nr:EAL domain-containing protein [Herbaspirillum rubrisubalbicans]MCP1576962.1 EAL domain-containing protein (putative c-di-GMP-specific phosphodiesterase class I) [Herbaspirillum rubrisubalbicans]RAM64273.1 signal peptide protein [Herbaspirillum rubrisubalbicans]
MLELIHPSPKAASLPMSRTQLLHALRQRQFRPFFQPIVGADGAWLGAEILMRWQHPGVGVLAPDEFIGRLDAEGLLALATRQMLRQVQVAWGQAQVRLQQPFFLSFNTCRQQLLGDSLVRHCQTLLQDLQEQQLQLMIEMPERGSDLDPAQCRELFDQFERAGLAVALDDFGIGDARLHQLACGRIDCIKLDRSFVAALLGNSLYSRLIEKILALAAVFDASVTAEGIETREQWKCLLRIGVRQFQGYYFARPLTAPDFFARMKRPGQLSSGHNARAAKN